MSLIEKKVSSLLQEKELKGESKLMLTENVMDQIDYLHKTVGSVEWSGVLVYKILEGSIEDYKNLVVEVQEILPMDVGTSSYTEYELSSADDYTFKNLFDRVMMDPELKIGHIHTHHSMSCFFSGTDTQELHDNAPNHNYYLSLIVNFKNFSEWCAKIALVGEQHQKGEIVSKYKGTSGDMIETIKTVDKSTKILYTINVDIDYKEPEKEEELTDFKLRVIDINKERGHGMTYATPSYESQGASVGGAWQRDNRTGLYGRGQEKQGNLFSAIEEAAKTPVSNVPSKRVKVDISEKSIRQFANILISQDSQPTGLLTTNINNVDHGLATYSEDDFKFIYMDSIISSFDELFLKHFLVVPSDESRELVVKKVIELLKEYEETFDFLKDVIDELEVNFVYEETIHIDNKTIKL